MIESTLRTWILLLVTFGSACGGDDTVVYVPGPGFVEDLHLITGRGFTPRVEVGEPLVLHAQRRSGPWIPAERRRVGDEECVSPILPPQLEAEVAARVTWLVDPQGRATLNAGTEAGTMEVRFDGPGTYFVTAQAPSPCGDPLRGDTLVITVEG
ncbi:MAG: hypothetical protein R3304_11175 [Longimicrobiales bacterium]|nr:hypothetical protein [Longimicrobiales bacterium]